MQKKEGELQLLQEELTTQRAQVQLLEERQGQAADRAAAAESDAAGSQAKLQGQLAEAMTLLDQRGKQAGHQSCSPGRCMCSAQSFCPGRVHPAAASLSSPDLVASNLCRFLAAGSTCARSS